jgi:4-amino-4-deoxy-L-arabinose transferase-like glycosyltransferase
VIGRTARIALLFFTVALLTRLPFQTDNLWAHDSVLYERAIERFDPLEQRPQPPGYLYYVLTIRAVDALPGDANRAMTLVSLLAGALAIALLYVLARRMYDERTALIAALFLMSAVTFWAYAGVAYPYTLLAALTIGGALALWRAATATAARTRALVVASAVIGIAIGFRSDLAIFLAPVWFVAAWGTPVVGWIAAAATGAAFVALWYVASAAAGGGLDRFAAAVREQSAYIEDAYSMFGRRGLGALSENAYELARYLGRGLYFLAPFIPLALLSAAARHIELADRRRALFLVAWTAGPLLVYLPIHVGEYGYVFSMLPGLCVIAARGAIAFARGLRMPRTLPWVVASVVLTNAAIFLVSDSPLSATDLVRRDRGITEKFDYLRSSPELARASILTAYDFEVVRRYDTDQHNVATYDAAAPGRDVVADAPILVVWDDLLRVHGSGWLEVRMPHGARLRIARDMTGVRVRVEGLDVTLER